LGSSRQREGGKKNDANKNRNRKKGGLLLRLEKRNRAPTPNWPETTGIKLRKRGKETRTGE